jgi:hypothetical protein
VFVSTLCTRCERFKPSISGVCIGVINPRVEAGRAYEAAACREVRRHSSSRTAGPMSYWLPERLRHASGNNHRRTTLTRAFRSRKSKPHHLQYMTLALANKMRACKPGNSTLSTSRYPDQARLVRRYASRVCKAFLFSVIGTTAFATCKTRRQN